jgi:hypothetical protein
MAFVALHHRCLNLQSAGCIPANRSGDLHRANFRGQYTTRTDLAPATLPNVMRKIRHDRAGFSPEFRENYYLRHILNDWNDWNLWNGWN